MSKKLHQSSNEHFAKVLRKVTNTAAYRALPLAARLLATELKFEWKGPRANNNGDIALSVRQAASRLGVSVQTAAKAFYELQAKGFIVVTEIGHPGVQGSARGTRYELTEIALPHAREGRHLYRLWSPSQEFDVAKAKAHNPKGVNQTSAARS